jgi:hypothetical protein
MEFIVWHCILSNNTLYRDSSGRRRHSDRLGGSGSIPGCERIFTSPYCPDRLWGPSSLLSNWWWGGGLRGKAAGAWSWPLTSNTKTVRNIYLYIHSPKHLHCVVLIWLSTAITLPLTLQGFWGYFMHIDVLNELNWRSMRGSERS